MYDSVQLVQNSAALNGTQRVLLDHVISEQECSDLRHLAHVRAYTTSTNHSSYTTTQHASVVYSGPSDFKDYTWPMTNDCVFLGLHETSPREPVSEADFWLSPLTSRLSPWQETVTEAGCLLTLQMRSSKEPQC